MTPPREQAEKISITIDGQPLEVPKGTLVIRAAEELGITIPRFCDHPLLDPVAACRQCLVDVEGQRKPLAACSTTVMPDMVVRSQHTSELAREAQEAQLEFLLLNHPLDCPQCDKGGECPLQDQALLYGPPDSRMTERKRVFSKSVPINPQITLDREKCVLCARCTRFSKEISGDPFIELFERGALEQVAIYEDTPYQSYFSGNVVQICPVGALTSNSYRFQARPFDVRRMPGIAYHDASGANVRHDVRRGLIQRTLARTNLEVNDAWLDDRNRYGFGFITHADRLRDPVVRSPIGTLETTSWVTAVRAAAQRLGAIIERDGSDAVAVLAGGRLTDEDAYALSRFARDVVGTDNVDFRLDPGGADEVAALRAVAGAAGATYTDLERASVVVVAGLEPHEEAPLLYLRLRKAWRNHATKIVVIGPVAGRLAEIAWQWLPTAPGEEGQALRALASGEHAELAPIRDRLGEDAVVLVGERLGAYRDGLPAALDLAGAVGGLFGWVPRRPGARGAVEAGLMPGTLPGGRSIDEPGEVAETWQHLPAARGRDMAAALQGVLDGDVKALYLVGVDPVRDFADPALAAQALEHAELVVSHDLMATDSVRRADVILPAVAPPERVGSFTNWEGRRQAWPQAVGVHGKGLPDWDILRQVARAMGRDLGWETAADVRREAAPLMTGHGTAPDRFAARNRDAADTPGSTDAPTDPVGEGPLEVVLLPTLLGRSTMLSGAAELIASAPAPTVWVHPSSAGGLTQGQQVTVAGPGGSLTLGLQLTTAVAPGVAVLPRNATDAPATTLGRGRFRVSLAPAGAPEGER